MENALPHRTAGAPRTWQLCMTSENHGTVGPAGCKFTHAPDKHERVLVVEALNGTGASSTAHPDWLEYDQADHILTIYGVKYSGDLFSGLGLGPVGMSFTILARENGALTLCRGPVAAQAVTEPANDDLLEIARSLCAIAARRGELTPERLKHYPHVDEEGSPTLIAARAACVARGYTEDGLSVEGITYPVPAQASQVTVPGWISVDERLPEGCYCLATYRDRAGKLRIIRAMYVRQFEIEANGDECDSETNEANDREYLKAGWYEPIDNWGDYSSVNVCEGPVTHWMTLPALPGAQASTSGERQEGGAA